MQDPKASRIIQRALECACSKRWPIYDTLVANYPPACDRHQAVTLVQVPRILPPLLPRPRRAKRRHPRCYCRRCQNRSRQAGQLGGVLQRKCTMTEACWPGSREGARYCSSRGRFRDMQKQHNLAVTATLLLLLPPSTTQHGPGWQVRVRDRVGESRRRR